MPGTVGGNGSAGSPPVLPADAGSWAWPAWLRQLVESGRVRPGDAVQNPGSQQETPLGILGADGCPASGVDRSGLITPVPGGFSLDWYVGSGDRWYVPSRETTVRQQLLDGAPVVDTTMRAGGGDIRHRVFAVAGPGAWPELSVEVANRSNQPVAIALSVRPVNSSGLSPVTEVDCHMTGVDVDGRPALRWPVVPRAVYLSTGVEGDAASELFGGDPGTGPPSASAPRSVRCGDGLGTAVFVWPLGAGVTWRVRLPTAGSDTGERSGGPSGRAPEAEQVARAWRANTESALRLDLPGSTWADALDIVRCLSPLLVSGSPPSPAAALAVTALDEMGYRSDAATVLAGWVDTGALERRRLRRLPRRSSGPDAVVSGATRAAVVWALVRHWELGTPNEPPVPVTLVGSALELVARDVLGRPAGSGVAGLVWAAVTLARAVPMLAALDEPAAAQQTAKWAQAAEAEARRTVTAQLAGSGSALRAEEGALAGLLAAGPLGLVEPSDPLTDAIRLAAATVVADLGEPCPGEDLLWLAGIEAAAGQLAAPGRIDEALRRAGPTKCWPSQEGRWSLAAPAALWWVMRRTLVAEAPSAPGVLKLLPWLPEVWRGQPLFVEGLPTAAGPLSLALRWHGSRPAVLWEVGGERPVTVRAPSLDPSWQSAARKGEALFEPVSADTFLNHERGIRNR